MTCPPGGQIAEFGYRRDGVTLSEEEFWKKREKTLKYLTPIELNARACDGFRFGDPAQNALAIRERPNRVGLMTTIIFINYTTPKGREISGYIDYANSLFTKNWKKFFQHCELFYPDEHDLGFYDWKKGKTLVNDSLYYKTLMSPKHGLVFQNKFDRMLIIPDPYKNSPGVQTKRTKIKTSLYNSFVLLDHTLRSRK